MRLGTQSFRLVGHKGFRVSAVAFAYSPNGKLVAALGNDGSVSLFEASNGRRLRLLGEPGVGGTSVAFSADGKKLVIGGRSSSFWNIETGKQIFIRPASLQFNEIPQLVLSPDGKRMALGGGPVYIRDTATQKDLHTLQRKERGQCWSILFSGDGKTLITGWEGFPHEICFWDVMTGKQIRSIKGVGDKFHAAYLALSPDGRFLATGGERIRLWDTATGKEIRVMDGPGFRIGFSPDGRTLFSCYVPGVVLYETSTGKKRMELKGFAKRTTFAFSPDGRRVLMNDEEGGIHFMDWAKGKEISPPPGHEGPVLQVIPSPDNKLLTLGLNKLIIWDLATGKEVRHYQSSQNWTGPVAVSPDGKTLALGGEDIRLQELVTGREIIRLNTAGRAKAMTFSPDGKWLVTNDGEIYAVPSGKIHRRIATMGLPPVAFSPDGRFFASAGTQLWDPVAGKLIHHIKDNSQESLLFTPDSKSLLLGQHEVRIYDTKTGKMRSNIKTSSTCPLALAPDGRLLAGAKDADVVLWNLASGEEVLRLKGHGARVLSVAFGLDGKTLFSGSGDTTCLVWDLPALELPVGQRPFAALPTEQALARLRIGDKKILVEALDHPEPDVRSKAVWELAMLAAKDRSLLAILTRALADKDDNVRKSAVFALQKIGKLDEGAVPHLIQALKKASSDDIVFPIVDMLGFFGPKAREALPVLVVKLQERNLGRHNSWRDLQSILTLLRKIDPEAKDIPTPALLVAREIGTDEMQKWARRMLVQKEPALARGEISKDSLQRLHQAMMLHVKENGALPAPAIYSKDGRPLLSWRVALLPYLGQEKLYQRFRRDENWDSPHNRELLHLMPKVFAPAEGLCPEPHSTFFKVFTGPGTLFQGQKGITGAQIQNPAAILIVEAGKAVPWTKPGDVGYSPDQPLSVSGPFPDRVHVCLYPGDVRTLKSPLTGGPLQGLVDRTFRGVHPFFEMLLDFWAPAPAPSGKRQPPPFDRQGDPLPTGAVARLGTSRLRHPESISSLAFSPDSKRLASGGGGIVRVWDAGSAKEILRFSGAKRNYAPLVFAPDGKAVVGIDQDQAVCFWDASTGKVMRRVIGKKGLTTVNFALSPDGKYLAINSGNVTLWLADSATGKDISPPGLSGAGGYLHFSRDGQRLFAGRVIWDLKNQKAVHLETKEFVSSAALSSDGKYLATGHGDPFGLKNGKFRFRGSVRLWDAATGKFLRQLGADQAFVRGVRFSPDDKILAVAGQDPTVRLLNLETGKEVGRLPSFFFSIHQLAFSPDAKLLAASDQGNKILIWNLNTRELLHQEGSINAVRYSPDGKQMALARDNAVWLVETGSGKEVGRLQGHQGRILGLAYSPDGKMLASAGSYADGTTRLWDLATEKEIRCFKDHGGVAAFSPNGKFLASGRQPLRLREATTGKELATFDHFDVRGLAFAADSKLLAVGYDAFHSRIYEVPSGASLCRFGLPKVNASTSCLALDFSPRVNTLAFIQAQDGLHFLEIEPGNGKRSLHQGIGLSGSALCYSPDGKILAVGKKDGTTLLHDLTSKRELARYEAPHQGEVVAIAFSPDGAHLTSVYSNGTALIWRKHKK